MRVDKYKKTEFRSDHLVNLADRCVVEGVTKTLPPVAKIGGDDEEVLWIAEIISKESAVGLLTIRREISLVFAVH